MDHDKHNVRCEGGLCRHGEHEFRPSETRYGLAYAVLIPSNCIPDRRKFLNGAVELKVRGYEVIPPSLHPSGVRYEWLYGGPFKDDGSIAQPPELTCEELRQLISALSEPEDKPQAKPEGKPTRRPRLRELGDDRLVKIKEAVKPAYVPGNR